MNSVLSKGLVTSTRLSAYCSHIRSHRSCFSDKHRQFTVAPYSSRTMPSKLEWAIVPAHDSIPAYSIYTNPVQKSLQDDREYRIIRLENGLSATIVHDPTADKAAASLNVAVGHLSDPVSRTSMDIVFCHSLTFC